jgi:RimJ/RimL family protein N-acetyltransferase
MSSLASERVIRLAEPSDTAALGEAHAEAWLTAYADLISPEVLAEAVAGRRMSWPRYFTSPRRSDFTVFVSITPQMLEGFAILLASPEREGWTEIHGFHFHPDAWGTGASVALMEAVLNTVAPESPGVHLWTHRDTPRAHRFYEKVGFSRTGQARDLAFSDNLILPEVEYARSVHHPETRPDAPADPFRWVELLPPDDRQRFAEELPNIGNAAGDLDSDETLSQFVDEWRSTAEIHADPVLANRLRLQIDTSGPVIPAP